MKLIGFFVYFFFLESDKIDTAGFKPKQPAAQQTGQQQPQSSQIKINLKFNKGGMLKTVSEQQQQEQQAATSSNTTTTTTAVAATKPVGVKKSRFSSNVSNVVQEQNRFKEQQQQQQQQQKVTTAVANVGICNEDMDGSSTSKDKKEEEEETTEQCDIVYHIEKWPDALKNFCARVYKQYAQSTQVSEDQVTKYLQKRITDAFKVRADLNTGWETEKIPEIYDIKQVSL